MRGVRYLDLLTGEECFQPADVVVLAAFTLTNTRLLLSAGIVFLYFPRPKQLALTQDSRPRIANRRQDSQPFAR